MEILLEHNLDQLELQQALVALIKSSDLEDGVLADLNKSASCDDEPKEITDPVVSLFVELMDAEYAKAQRGIKAAVEKIVAGDKSILNLFKAKPSLLEPELPLTSQQIRAIQQAIRDRFDYIAATMDSDFTPDDLTIQRWKKEGIIERAVKSADFAATIPETAKLVRNAFVFGRLHMAINKGARNYEDILRLALTAPLTRPDEYAIKIAEKQAASYITQFGESLATDAAGIALKRNRQLVHDMVVKVHAHELHAVRLNQFAPDKIVTTWQELASELYHTMDDRARDWKRIAYYEFYDAKRHGEALALIARYGKDQLVYKSPMATACPQCKYLYLNDDEVTPRLFTIGEMLSYGNNIGRKPWPVRGGVVTGAPRGDGAETMKATSGLIHCWCQCQGPFPATGLEHWYDKAMEYLKKEK